MAERLENCTWPVKLYKKRRLIGCTHMNLHKKVEFSIFLFFNSAM